jgi:hypothetical protein
VPRPAANPTRNCRRGCLTRHCQPGYGAHDTRVLGPSKNIQVTYTGRHVPRAATNTNLLFDRLYRLLRQLFTRVEFHEQHHALVLLIFRHLANYEAVRYPLNVVIFRDDGWPGKACVEDIIYLGGPEPDATRIPKSRKAKDRRSG